MSGGELHRLVVVALEIAIEAFEELSNTAISIIEDTYGAPREGNNDLKV